MKKIITLLFFVGMSLSAFSTLVTFKIDMRDSGVEFDTVFIVGIHTEWLFVMMDPDDAGEGLYTHTFNLNAGDSTAFYFITQGNWTNYLDFREIVPEDCDFSVEYSPDHWEGDRGLEVPTENTTFAYTWSSCDVPPEYNAIKKVNSDLPSFVVFPNPADESLTINWTGLPVNGIIEIIDLSGKTIRSFNLKGTTSSCQLDISDINSGVYLMKVSDGKSSEYRKIVIN
jgi:hypothetical protein